MIRFYLRKKPISWNVFYAGVFWGKRVATKEEWVGETIAALREQKIDVRNMVLPLRIEIESCAKRPVDPDNIASAKFIIDGIKRVFRIDDSWKNIESVTLKSRKASENCIFVIIKDADDQ